MGVSLSLFVSQLISWPISFIMPLITMVLLLFPIPAPSLKQAAVFILALALPMYLCIALMLPLFEISRMAAILLLDSHLVRLFLLFGSWWTGDYRPVYDGWNRGGCGHWLSEY